jgi:hypothetical protein
MDIAQPAAPIVGSLDPVASQVTTQNAEPNAPQAETPAGTEEQSEKAVEETAEQKTASEETQSQDGEQPKTWKEKRQERNRDRWQAFKQAKEVLPARLESLEKEVARLRGTAPPDFSQIVDPNEELAERTAWKVQQRQAADSEARLNSERQTAAVEQTRAMAAAWEESKQEARERIPDFDQVVTDATPIHQRAAPFIVESEKGAEIAYYLGKNPKAANDLFEKFNTAPAQALIELGRIEARLTAPAPKTLSTAPKPAPTLGGGANPLQFDAARASVDDMAARLRASGLIR